MALHNKNIIVDNLLINYYFYQPKKSEKTIVFLHGWGVDSQSWFKIVPRLVDKKYSLFFLDLPGFGNSQMPPSAFSLEDYKRIVLEFIKKLRLKKIVIVGHSFGGRIAIKIASTSPNPAEKIVLVDAAGINNLTGFKKLTAIFARLISPVFRPQFMQPIRRKLYFLMGSEYLDRVGLSKIFSRVVSENLTLLLPKIKNETLILWGDRDNVTPLYYARLMKKLITKSKLTIFPGIGHFPFIEKPGEFTGELLKFI